MVLPSFLKLYFLLVLIGVLNISTSKSLKEESKLFGGNFPALYVIGDSLVDAGNNNQLLTRVKANFPPYGSNFEGGKPTGRFSDGKTIADFIASYYGLPLAPAYLGLSEEEKNNISTGFNYASASCGVFPDTGKIMGQCLSLSVQVDLFNQTIEMNLKKKFKTQSELNKHLSESLFMIAIGVNDYAFFFKRTSNVNEFSSRLIHDYLTQIERLHKLGARKFFVNNVKPLGCYPNMITQVLLRGTCNKFVNLAIQTFNYKLRLSLSDMKNRLCNTSFLYSDYFNFMMKLRDPSSNQASPNPLNTTSPCCPTVYDGGLTTSCTPPSKACERPENFIFFDPFHPTQLANSKYADACFNGTNVCHVV